METRKGARLRHRRHGAAERFALLAAPSADEFDESAGARHGGIQGETVRGKTGEYGGNKGEHGEAPVRGGPRGTRPQRTGAFVVPDAQRIQAPNGFTRPTESGTQRYRFPPTRP
ncbi:hypothetical protein GCM10023083_90220 [Streptomyces phyllanthi]